jgi:hypothetical protein
MVTGQNNLEERIGELDKELDEIQDIIKIPHNLIDISEFLNRSIEDIRQLKPNECEEIAILLGEYAITLKSKLNKMLAKRNWLQSNIQWMGRTENAQKLTKLKVDLSLQIDSIYGLSEQISGLAKYYNDLGKTKKWK